MHLRLNICKLTGCIACVIFVAQISRSVEIGAQTNLNFQQKPSVLPPPPPFPKQPIEFFRQLLSMSPAERDQSLAEKSPERKKVLLAKLKEYEAMESGKRETRLRVTELRWYLAPLMKVAPAERSEWLVVIPPEKRPLVQERLKQWDELSPSQQKEFWDNEMAINYFLRLQSSTPEQQTNLLQGVSAASQAKLEKEFAQWISLPAEQRERMCKRFAQFFDLNSKEKEKTLGTLSDAERLQMEKTLEKFQNLSVGQRRHCIESFRKFARMDVNERNQFLKKAEMWESMSPVDRKAWRDLVQKLPQMPPLPPGLKMPPLPPSPLIATNSLR